MSAVVLHRQPAPGVRAAVLKTMGRYLGVFATGMHAADDLTLTHEARRLEGLPTSPVVSRMRAIVAAEQTSRRSGGAL